jgi:hypothetical protein
MGSDPFSGTILLKGEPLTTIPPGALGLTDTVVKRSITAMVDMCGSEDTIPIEIVALSLVSSAPITVTLNGGMTPQSWSVKVCLSDSPQMAGMMTIRHECPDGGTYDATLPVTPKFIFTRLDGPGMVTLDAAVAPMPMPYGALTLEILGAHWVHMADPSFGVVTSAGGVMVDGNCNGMPDPMPLPATSNFVAGIRSLPCTACTDPAGGPQAGAISGPEAKVNGPRVEGNHPTVPVQQPPFIEDEDGDDIPDLLDNCPIVPNPEQTDTNDDSVGNACDQDSDAIRDDVDNCPGVFNPNQDDEDMNGIGDACELPATSTWGLMLQFLLVCTVCFVLIRRRKLKSLLGTAVADPQE